MGALLFFFFLGGGGGLGLGFRGVGALLTSLAAGIHCKSVLKKGVVGALAGTPVKGVLGLGFRVWGAGDGSFRKCRTTIVWP